MAAAPRNLYVADDDDDDDDEECNSWVRWFCQKKGNEYFCDVDSDFILDRFNLTGLGHDVPHAQQAYDAITDEYSKPSTINMHMPAQLVDGEDDEDTLPPHIESAAHLLYGLIHARFIISPNGLGKMKRKFVNGEFGQCPRVFCRGQNLIPVGLSDCPRTNTIKLYCCHCEDIYNPKSSAHSSVDGAFFGTTFPHLFFQTYPNLLPVRSSEAYIPKIFGFRIAGSTTCSKLETAEKNHTMQS